MLPAGENVRIERSGTQRWIVARGDPAQLWVTVKDFWQENGFVIAQENPTAGTMETDWAEDRAKIPQDGVRSILGKFMDGMYSTPERDKFRTRLELGSDPGTTDIFISHRGMYEIFVEEGKERTVWQPRPADPNLEAEMLRRLMVKLGVQETKAKTEVAAAPQEERAKLVRGADGISQLELDDDVDRAWRRVGLALDRVGFTVEDRDRSQGVYFVRYVDPAEEAEVLARAALQAQVLGRRREDPECRTVPCRGRRRHQREHGQGARKGRPRRALRSGEQDRRPALRAAEVAPRRRG